MSFALLFVPLTTVTMTRFPTSGLETHEPLHLMRNIGAAWASR